MPRTKAKDALSILKEDHKKVKVLFDRFEKAKEAQVKRAAAEEAIMELKVHTAAEEEIFYPAARRQLEDPGLVSEAREEHHVAKLLIAELEQLKQGDPDRFEAKFMVLSESVRHHIKEEEGELFPEVKKTDLDLQELADQISRRKEELKSGGVPSTEEESLVKAGAAAG